MLFSPPQAIRWTLGGGAMMLGTLLSVAATEVWTAKADHEKRITTIEVERKGDHELLIEVRQDVKELLQRATPAAAPRP